MKVNEFSKRLGIPKSKIRYYDRVGLINGDRQDNNYRNFSNLDALEIYNAQLLRSFDMSIEDTINAKGQTLDEINGWFYERAEELEEIIQREQMKLLRIQTMQEYFEIVNKKHMELTTYDLDDSYNIFSLNSKDPSEDIFEAMEILADIMPYSYVAVRISKDSIYDDTDRLDVAIGLGILEKNKQKLNIELPKSIKKTKGGQKLNIALEVEDPLGITKEQLSPLIKNMTDNNEELECDLVGRIYISYMKNDRFVHGIGLGATTKKI